MGNNKLRLIITLVIAITSSIVLAQNVFPKKYYSIESYYDSKNCNRTSIYLLNKNSKNKLVCVLNVKDSLLMKYSIDEQINKSDSLIRYSYQSSTIFYGKDDFYYSFFDESNNLVCKKEYSSKTKTFPNVITQWDENKRKIYTERNSRNNQVIRRWSSNGQIESCIKRKLIYNEKRLQIRALDGCQRIWHPNGKIKYIVHCKEKKVIRYKSFNLKGTLLETQKYSIEDNILIKDVIKEPEDKSHFYYNISSCDQTCPFL